MRVLAGRAILLVGMLLAADALWIPGKAKLAQYLLASSWARARDGEARPRPWPWADTWPVARLEVPRLDVERIVLAGASGSTLAFAPGHVDGTADPASGGNAMIAGHRDTSFRFLAHLAIGDSLSIERPDGGAVHYRVESTAVVDAADPSPFFETGDTLTLVTCWPFDALVPGGRLRYVVRARRASARLGARRPAVSSVSSPVLRSGAG